MGDSRPRSAHDLPRLADTLSFLYFEHCRIDAVDDAVVAIDESGRVPIPVATLTTLLLGPGTRITQRAIMTIADHGCGVVWVGEHGVRFYAGGTGRNRSSRLAERQAAIWANPTTRKRMARRLYQMRFPGEAVSRLSMAQLRGREGARVRRAYQEWSRRTGVPWDRRSYDRSHWQASDPVNQALSVANSCLYGVCHAAIVALGLVASLGFIHTGDRLSFVFDVADLYKAETTIPAAFLSVAGGELPLERTTRRACRDMFRETRLIERVSRDLTNLFGSDRTPEDPDLEVGEWESILLWDPDEGSIGGGINYGDDVMDHSDDDLNPWS
jgi:CRISPR-associated protein Cas1